MIALISCRGWTASGEQTWGSGVGVTLAVAVTVAGAGRVSVGDEVCVALRCSRVGVGPGWGWAEQAVLRVINENTTQYALRNTAVRNLWGKI
jgi:hypothetical protein